MWWLISSETAEKIKLALVENEEAYMLMDTGLHITDAVPNDYETDFPSRQRVRELITCLYQRCDLKTHNEADTKIITDFIKDFYGESGVGI